MAGKIDSKKSSCYTLHFSTEFGSLVTLTKVGMQESLIRSNMLNNCQYTDQVDRCCSKADLAGNFHC